MVHPSSAYQKVPHDPSQKDQDVYRDENHFEGVNRDPTPVGFVFILTYAQFIEAMGAIASVVTIQQRLVTRLLEL